MKQPKRSLDHAEIKRLYMEETLSVAEIAERLGALRYTRQIKDILESQGIEILCWCRLPLKGHTRCAGCGILVGPKHTTKTIEQYKGNGYCDSCFERRVRGVPPEGWDRFYCGESSRRMKNGKHIYPRNSPQRFR